MEDETFRADSICYAVNLAKRIDCSISVLMLLPNANDDSENVKSKPKRNCIETVLDMIREEEINTQGTSRYGDKASGLLKHLTTYPSFEAIIWGGKEEIASKHNIKRSDHWLTKIRSSIRCPVISPTKKYKIQRKTYNKEH